MSEIQDEYDRLRINKKNYDRCVFFVVLFLIAGFVTFLATIEISRLTDTKFILIVLIPAGCLIASFLTAWYSNRFFINKDKRLFFNFYGIYFHIKDFIDKKSNNTQVKALDEIYDTHVSVSRWVESKTPSVISQLPKSIYKNLDILWSLIDETEIDERKITAKDDNDAKYKELGKFNDQLYEFVTKIFEEQLTFRELENFNKSFDKLRPPKQKPSLKKQIKIVYEKIFTFFEKYPRIRFMFSPLTGIVVGLVLYAKDSTRDFDALSTGILAGIMIFVVIITKWKQKQ